jgi:hypothetical protein
MGIPTSNQGGPGERCNRQAGLVGEFDGKESHVIPFSDCLMRLVY